MIKTDIVLSRYVWVWALKKICEDCAVGELIELRDLLRRFYRRDGHQAGNVVNALVRRGYVTVVKRDHESIWLSPTEVGRAWMTEIGPYLENHELPEQGKCLPWKSPERVGTKTSQKSGQ